MTFYVGFNTAAYPLIFALGTVSSEDFAAIDGTDPAVIAALAKGLLLNSTFNSALPGLNPSAVNAANRVAVLNSTPFVAPPYVAPLSGLLAWTANTIYAAGQPVLNPKSQVVTVLANFTSGASYDATKFSPSPDATYGFRAAAPNLLRPHPVGGLVMGTPPTVAQSVGGAASAITAFVSIAPLDTRVTFLGCGTPQNAKDFPYSLFAYTNNVYPNPNLVTLAGNPIAGSAGSYYRISFGFDGLTFEFKLQGAYANGNYRVRVNGQRATGAVVTGVSDGQQYLVKVTFATAGPRAIEIEMIQAPFGGLNIGPTDNIWQLPRFDGPRALWLGDSFIGGSGTLNQVNSFATTASDLLGWEPFLSGVGGTGLLNAGTAVTARSRVGTDVTPWAPDVIVDAMGHNDTGSTQSAITSEATLLYQALQAGSPRALVIALGPLPSQAADSSSAGYLNVRNGKQAAASAVPGVIFVDTLLLPIFPGANAAGYVQGDSIHPTPAGAEYLGWQVEQRIRAALAAVG